MLNGDLELQVQKTVPHRDFYNVRKVGPTAGALQAILL